MTKENKIVRIALSGGIIGALFTNPRRTLENRIHKENQEGWNAIYFLPHSETNQFIWLVRMLVLLLTLFLWTFGAGYLILFEKEKKNSETGFLKLNK